MGFLKKLIKKVDPIGSKLIKKDPVGSKLLGSSSKKSSVPALLKAGLGQKRPFASPRPTIKTGGAAQTMPTTSAKPTPMARKLQKFGAPTSRGRRIP